MLEIRKEGVTDPDFLTLDETMSDETTYVYRSGPLSNADDGSYDITAKDFMDAAWESWNSPNDQF